MDSKKIVEIISNYDELIELTNLKIKVISKYDSYYNTRRGIESIKFGPDDVNVVYDDTCMGCYDSGSFSFPIKWLSKSDEDLEQIVILNKELRLEKKRLKEEEKKKELKEKRDEKEKADYERLKKKFE